MSRCPRRRDLGVPDPLPCLSFLQGQTKEVSLEEKAAAFLAEKAQRRTAAAGGIMRVGGAEGGTRIRPWEVCVVATRRHPPPAPRPLPGAAEGQQARRARRQEQGQPLPPRSVPMASMSSMAPPVSRAYKPPALIAANGRTWSGRCCGCAQH